MKIAKFLFAFCLVFASISTTHAQGNLWLESVNGEYAPDSLSTNVQIDFNIYFQNQSLSSNVTEFIHKFRISSDEGAVWNNAVGFFENSIESHFDLTTIDDFTTTGSLIDTITFSGLAFQQPAIGAPPGYEEVAFRITIGPFGSADHGKAVCLDSSLAVPGESWLWMYDQQTLITPEWDGPHCFTVIDPNQLQNNPPVITPLGSFTANETDTVTFAILASDADQDFVDISMTSTNLPASAIFDPLPNINGVANLTWPTGYDDSGSYFAEFTATDGQDFDIDTAFITVNNTNRAPVVTPTNDTTIAENQQLVILVTASDDDGDVLSMEFDSEDMIPLDSFVDNGNNSGTLSWTPTSGEAGLYQVIFTAIDGSSGFDQDTIVITVIAANQPPVLNPIGNKIYTEGVYQEFDVWGFDPDGNNFFVTSSSIPPGATFSSSSGGMTFAWQPGFDQAGTYSVTFYITDIFTAVDSEVVTITVNNFNSNPVLNPVTDTSIDENSTLVVTLIGNDAEGDSLDFFIYSISGQRFPDVAEFSYVENGDNTATFTYTPNFDAASDPNDYWIGFAISDPDEAQDADTIVITVNNINRPPVIATVDTQFVDENQFLQFQVNMSDPDGDTPDYNVENAPLGMTDSDNNEGDVTVSWTPGFDQAGTYNVSFIAEDLELLADTEVVTIVVSNVNLAPVLDPIADTNVSEGDSIGFFVTATDFDDDAITMNIIDTDLPGGYQFNQVLTKASTQTYEFSWIPTFDDSGSYTATFIASDGQLVDSVIISIEVFNENQAPVITPLVNQTFPETVILDLFVTASDADGDPISLQLEFASTLPGDAIFTDSGNGNGSIYWETDFDDAGVYQAIVRADDPNDGVDFDTVQITVVDQNRAPVVTPINDTTIDENQSLVILVTATDDDGDSLNMDYFDVDGITGETFLDNGNNTATFTWTPTFDDSGSYTILFSADDGNDDFDEDTVVITVNNVNQAPVLTTSGDQTVNETDDLYFEFFSNDPDGDQTTVFVDSAQLPTGAFLSFEGSEYAWIDWSTDYDDSGVYPIRVYATDNIDTVFEDVTFTVNNANRAPVLALVSDTGVDENDQLTFEVTSTDDDNDNMFMSIVNDNLPVGYTFEEIFVRTTTTVYRFDWTPTFDDAGNYTATIVASDGVNADSQIISIDVFNVDRPAVLDPIGSKSVAEGDTLEFTISGSDPDGVTVTFDMENAPPFSDLNDNDDGTADFFWAPGPNDSGTYNVSFFVYGNDFETVDDTEIVTITVGNVNQPPVLNPIGSQVFTEGQFNSFFISGFDPDGGFVSFSVDTLPDGAQFFVGEGTSFEWTPDFDQAGQYTVRFIVTDDSGATDFEDVLIQVNNVNRQPSIGPINPVSVDEGDSVEVIITATDPDTDDSLYFVLGGSEFGPPPNASYNDNGDGTLTATFTPSFDDAGTYDLEIFVYDTTGSSNSDALLVTYNQVNQPPVLDSIASPVVFVENEGNGFDVSGSDPDGDGFTFSIDSLPTGASFGPQDGGAGFYWVPGFDQQGSYDVYFYITDDSGATDSQLVTLVVTDVACTDLGIASFTLDGPQQISTDRFIQDRLNLSLNNLGPLSVDSQFTITFYYSSQQWGTYDLGTQTVDSAGLGIIDIDLTDPIYMNPDAATNDSAYLVVVISNTNVAECDFSNNTDSIPFELVNNIPSVLDSIGDKVVNEGETLGILLTATDADGDFLEFDYFWQEEVFPNNFTFTDSGNGVAYFELTPDFNDAGVYDIEFSVQDYYGVRSGGGSFDFESIIITVVDVNRPPMIDTLPDTMYVTENDFVQFNVSATEPDGECVELSFFSPDLPPEAQFDYVFDCVDNGDFSWQTDFDDEGTYSAFFVVTDFNSADTDLVTIVVQNDACPDLVSNNLSLVDGDIRISRGAPLKPRLTATVENIGTATTGGPSTVAFYISTDSVFSPQTDLVLFSGRVVIGEVLAGNTLDVNILDNMELRSFPDGPAYLLMVTDELAAIAECDEQNNVGWLAVEVVGNILPIAVPTPDTTIDENQNLLLTIIGIDPDSEGVFINDEDIPSGASLNDNEDGTATFDWTPNYFDAGNYEVIVRIYDFTEASVTDSFTITVNNVNRPPQYDEDADDVTVNEGEDVDFYTYAFDPDFEQIFYSAESPTISNDDFDYDDDGKGGGRFEWTPSFGDAGIHTFYLYAEDSLGGQDVDTVLIMVNNINVPPVFDPISPVNVDENVLVNFNITASDFDGTTPALTVDLPLPLGASFVDNGNGTATFNWTPDCNQSIIEGSYFFRCYASDDSGAVDTGFINISVNEACDVQLTVQEATCVQCVPPQNYADILVYDFGFVIQFNNQVIPSTIDGNISFNSLRGTTFDYDYNDKLKQIEVTPVGGLFAPADTIMVRLESDILDLNEAPLDSAYSLVYRTGGLVYPGDCNNDGVVNEVDVLSIGLFFNNTGPARDLDFYESGPFDFFPQPVHFEQGNQKWDPVLGVYADVDGSGLVDADDICGVAYNFGEVVSAGQIASSETLTPAEKKSMMKEFGSSVLQAMYDALIECQEDKAPELLEMIGAALRESSPLLPTEITLYQNYPNPFNPSTTIEFYLTQPGLVTLEIYNLLGQRVAMPFNENTEAGFKEIVWNGTDNSGAQVASGIYFYKLVTEEKVITKRMMLVK